MDRLSRKITLSLASIFILVLVSFGLLLAVYERQRSTEHMGRTKFLLDTVFEQKREDIGNEIFGGKTAALADTLDRMRGIRGILWVAVYDRDGREVAASGETGEASLRPEEMVMAGQGSVLAAADSSAPSVMLDGSALYTADIKVIGERIGFIRISYGLGELRQEILASYAFYLALLLTLVLITSLAVREILRRMVIAPIVTLKEAMGRVRDGRLDERVTIRTSDVIGEMAASFNQMTAALKDASQARDLAQQDLERVNASLERMVGERTAELVKANEDLRLMAMAFEHGQEGMAIHDARGNFLTVNRAFTAITGFTPEQAVGRGPEILRSGRHPEELYASIWTSLHEQNLWEGEIWHRRQNGETYPEWLSINTLRSMDGQITNFVSVFHDISGIKAQEELILRQALHDALTGLPNRILGKDRLEQALARARRHALRVAVLFLDLDDFKKINDTLGHATGDEMLQAAAGRLASTLRAEDTVARFGGDEFLVVIPNMAVGDEHLSVAQRLSDALAEPFELKERQLHIACSLGISIFPDDGEDVETLIRNADLAMYQAKTRGKGNVQTFSPVLHDRAMRHFSMENEMRRSLDDDSFSVVFQPQVDLASGMMHGVEALLRWDSSLGRISPGEFIPLAEQTSLIIPLGRRALQMACQEFSRLLHCSRPAPLGLAVNISPVQLRDQGLPETVARILAQHAIPCQALEIEITETAIMCDIDTIAGVLTCFSRNGISVAVDDFGTGFFSLSHLRRFPLGTIKIDRTFVADIGNNSGSESIIETMVAMGARLGLRVVAEGIETPAQAEFLLRNGCTIGQGYLFARPMPMDELLERAGRGFGPSADHALKAAG